MKMPLRDLGILSESFSGSIIPIFTRRTSEMSNTLHNLEELEIDELNFQKITCIGKQYDHIVFTNYDNLDIEINENTLYEHIKSIKGKDRIRHLEISYHSHLRNVEIVKLFPNLSSLRVNGYRIESLEGLECFKGDRIDIDTVKNRKRSIEKIAMIPIKSLCLEFSRKEDFDAIKKCSSLNSLTLGKCPNLDFYDWRHVPLEQLKFWNYCKITELRDMDYIETLTRIMVGACRKFERFAGDNSNIKAVIVEGSKLFDIHSITSLPNAEYIGILDDSREISFSKLPEHPTVKELKLWAKKVNIDIVDIKSKMPMLRKLDIAKTPKDQRRLLCEANPDIEIFAY